MKDTILEMLNESTCNVDDGQGGSFKIIHDWSFEDISEEIALIMQKYHEWIFSADCKFIFFYDGWWVTKESDVSKSHDELFCYWHDEIYKKEQK